jgi:hypothetical protein
MMLSMLLTSELEHFTRADVVLFRLVISGELLP